MKDRTGWSVEQRVADLEKTVDEMPEKILNQVAQEVAAAAPDIVRRGLIRGTGRLIVDGVLFVPRLVLGIFRRPKTETPPAAEPAPQTAPAAA